jgi:uncharacterized DUF497 family protein
MGREPGESQFRESRNQFRRSFDGFRRSAFVDHSDPIHSAVEDRFVIIGASHRGTLLVMVHTEGENPHHQRATR